MVVSLTFSNHAWDAKFGTVSYMDEGVEHTHKEADQHNWLGSIAPFYEVILLRKDVILQSSTDAIFLDRPHKESYIRGIIPEK